MSEVFSWSLDQFPVVYEQGEPKAVLVDFTTFQRLAFILDNLQNRGPEPEDAVLAESPEFHRLVERVRAVAEPRPDWKRELDEL